MSSETEPQLRASVSSPLPNQRVWDRSGCLELSLACVAFLVFVSTLSFGFVYDDRGIILNNPFIHSWRYLGRDFISQLWNELGNGETSYYRPIYISWLRLNYCAFGEKAIGWHLTTVASHAFATVLVFRMSLHVLRDRFHAAIAGLFFAVHPIHVENVSWIAGVVDPLLSIFFLASLLCYFNWRKEHYPVWRIGAVFFSICAVLTKEPGVVIPAVVLAYAWIFGDQTEPTRKRFRTALTHATPFILVSLLYLAVRRAVLGPAMPALSSSTTALLTFPGLLLFYLRQMAWPFGLSLFYDRQPLEHLTFGGFVIPSLLLILLAGVLFFWLRKNDRCKEIAFSVVMALLILSPVLWIRWFKTCDFMHDRYMYLPSSGLVILFAIVVAELGSRKALRPLAVVGVSVVFVIATASSQRYWANDLLLWSHAFKTAPRNPVVLNNLGSALGEDGDLKGSAALLLQAVRHDPNDDRAQANLGFTLYRIGDLTRAEEHLALAVQRNPKDAHSWLYLGVTHYKLGTFGRAETELRNAIRLDPSAKGVHLALSLVLEQRGDLAAAIQETRAELTLNPDERLGHRVRQLSEKK